MSNDARDEVYIDYYIHKRIMRKTFNQELLDKIYASKYSKWIVSFFKKKGIEEVPLLICCNTLYQLPDYFKIRNNSFFITDYNLYSYFYDLNYSLSALKRNEFVINLHVKTYIEQAFIKRNIDICYLLCRTSSAIEYFKETKDYKNKELASFLTELTDIQEAFTLLHEASHFFLEQDYPVIEGQDYQKICDYFSMSNSGLDSNFYNECYCDYNAISYILEKTYFENGFSRIMYFMALFSTLIYTYMLRFTMIAQNLKAVEFETYMDEELKLLVLRIGGIYFYIYNFLVLNEFTVDISPLNEAYEKSIDIFKKMGENLRTVIKLVRAFEEEYQNFFKNVSESDKMDGTP